jgi:hypothetical protein
MTVMDPRAATTDAASLSGLSVRAEAGLAAAGGQLRRALHALDAAAQGATDRALLNTFPRWRHRISNARVSEGGVLRDLLNMWFPGACSYCGSWSGLPELRFSVACLSMVPGWDCLS